MNMNEYLKVKDMTYLEYCDYLQEKYGIGLSDYMTKNWNKNRKCTKTNEGLIAHHKAEDKMILLSNRNIAQRYPFEWQKKENIVYCDYLEHLLLHVLICMYPSEDKIPGVSVGIGEIVTFLVPELNDLYSGWITNQPWRKKCHDLVANDIDVYFEILKKFINYNQNNESFRINMLFTSYNNNYGGWNIENNNKIFEKIAKYAV